LRLTAARRGAILASLVILLALMLGSQQPVAQQYTHTPSEVHLEHISIFVGAGDLRRYEFYVCDGCRFEISFRVYSKATCISDIIIFRALDPEGREIYLRSKVSQLRWDFTAERAGTYILEFDNTHSTVSKYVFLSLAVAPPPSMPSQGGTLTLVLVAAVAFIAGMLVRISISRKG
jgi:hypothetical protein